MRFLILLLLLASPACAAPLQSVSARILPQKEVTFSIDMKSRNGKDFSQEQITRSALGLLLIENTILFNHPTNECIAFTGISGGRYRIEEPLLGTMCCERVDATSTKHICSLRLEKRW